MKCSNCGEEMAHYTIVSKNASISYDVCKRCGSLWLDGGKLDTMAYQIDGSIEYSSKTKAEVASTEKMKCPRCEESELEKVFFLGCSDILLDRCAQCGGFWLDSGELDLINKELKEILPIKGKGFSEFLNNIHIPYWYKRIKKKTGEADSKIDVPPLKDAQLKEQTSYACPVCHSMLNVYSLYGTDIEGCPKCAGIWLDQDELRQLKDKAEKHTWGTLRWLDSEIEAIEQATGLQSQRTCPKCETKKLLSISFADSPVIIDWCPSCHGIWLDRSEFSEIVDYLKNKLNRMSSHTMKQKVAEEIKEIWGGPESNLSEILDAKASIAALVNTKIFEHPRLAKLLITFTKQLHAAGL